MRAIPRIVAALLCLLLAACAAGPAAEETPGGPAAQEKQAQPAKPAPEPVPVEERKPVPPEVLYEVFAGEIAGQNEDYLAAAHHYVQAARGSTDPAIAERATQIALFAGSNELAQQAVARLLELSPESRRAHTTAVTLAMHRGDAELARRHLAELLALESDPGQAWQQIARLLARAPDADFALARMAELVEQHDSEPWAWYAYSQLESHFDRLERALEHADRMLALRPDWGEGLAWRGRLRMSDADYEGAARDLKAAFGMDPEDRETRLHYAEALRRLGNYDRAQELLSGLPQEPDLVEVRASLAVEAENWGLARKLFQRLLEQPDYQQEARFYLGQIAEVEERYDEALEWYARVTGGGFRLDARVREASVLAIQGRLDEALKLLQQLRGEGAESAEQAWLAEGRILADAGRVEAAFDAYGKGIAELEDDSRIRYARALLAADQGRVQQAEDDLRDLIDSDPDDAQALNALGYTLAEQTERYDEALSLISRALEITPDDPAIIDSMGWVQYRLGNNDKAIENLRRALDMQFDAEIAAHLGEVLWVSGRRDEARSVWQRALDRLPDESDVVKRTMERLTP